MSKEIVMTEFSECTKRMNDFYDEFINVKILNSGKKLKILILKCILL